MHQSAPAPGPAQSSTSGSSGGNNNTHTNAQTSDSSGHDAAIFFGIFGGSVLVGCAAAALYVLHIKKGMFSFSAKKPLLGSEFQSMEMAEQKNKAAAGAKK